MINFDLLNEDGVLSKNMGRFFPVKGNFADRNAKLLDWIHKRINAGVWPYVLYTKGLPHTNVRVEHPSGKIIEGVNFTSVDYLGLSNNYKLKDAAVKAIHDFGIHSVSSGPLMGNSEMSHQLQNIIKSFLNYEHVFLCPTGWAAGFAAITGLVRKDDIVVMDELAHQCLQQGAYASTNKVFKYNHLDNSHAEQILKDLRSKNTESGIMLITEGLFSMDGDSPDLHELYDICKENNVLLLLDVAHDLGATGPQGKGCIGKNNLLGKVDIVVGSFSKTFGTNGGFIASKSPNIHWTIRCFGGSYTYSTALSPLQLAIAIEAFQIIKSEEGDKLRKNLSNIIHYTRKKCEDKSLTLLGSPSPIVPVYIGKESLARIAGALSFEKGLVATCLEFPVVQTGMARYRLSMSPDHTQDQVDYAVNVIYESLKEGEEILNVCQGTHGVKMASMP